MTKHGDLEPDPRCSHCWKRLREQLRIATDQLQAFSDQGQERYPGEMGTFAMDALIQMSVVEGDPAASTPSRVGGESAQDS